MTLPTSSASQSGEASAGNLAQDEPNYKALYTELKGEVLEKVGTCWLIEWPADRQMPVRYWHPTEGHVIDPNHAVRFCREEDAAAVCKRDHLYRGARPVEHRWIALSSLHEKRSSIGGSSSAETAASVASDLTAGEAQRTSDWRTIDSAPRDGTRFLAWAQTVALVSWWRRADSTAGGYFVHHEGMSPTHWQPLPPPPNPSARGEL